MEKERLQYLLERFTNDECTSAELDEINAWFHAVHIGDDEMARWINESGGEVELANESYDRLIHKQIKRKRYSNGKNILKAAAVLIIVSAAGLLIYKQNNPVQLTAAVSKPVSTKIEPGSNKATVTLANGSKIVLDDSSEGNVAEQGNIQIHKSKGGSIAYVKDESTGGANLLYNTLTTPRGGKYTLTLADGTTVMLDAASSIRYPVAFTGKDRQVEITGQAYFKVVHNAKQPFLVKVKNQVIRDIGTEFNISAYDDDPEMKATLVQGKVSISNAANKAVLVPGQQATVKNNDPTILINETDTDDIIAWTRDQFAFHHQQITDILKQASRWYDVEIVYQRGIPKETFGGMISRYKDITELLENMRITGGIHYKIEGRRVTIIN